MIRKLKMLWILLLTLGLVGFMGNSSVLMASHVTHFAGLKGPNLPANENGCLKCHAAPGTEQCGIDDAPLFRNLANPDGLPLSLADTDVCDPCHSPGGAFDGVGEVPEDPDNPDPDWEAKHPDSVAFGAKYNWEDGVYFSEYEQLPFWKANTDYEAGDIVLYKPKLDGKTKAYVAKHDLKSRTTTPDADKWKLIDSWKPNTKYYVGDLVRYNDKVWRSCRSPKFTTGGSPIADNWEWVKRTGAGEESLKKNKKKWCAGCHDRNLDDPKTTTSDAKIRGVYAPGVIGDNSTYGFYYNGHGKRWPNRPGLEIHCLDCHNSTFAHIDGVQRSFQVNDEGVYDAENELYTFNVITSYNESYRLKPGMIIPRFLELSEDDFALCMDTCHTMDPVPHSTVFSPTQYRLTNFRGRQTGFNLHPIHLNSPSRWWDADWDVGKQLESAISCPACHNVHGSPSPVMMRHGELISTPGETDKVPGIDYRWYKIAGDMMERLEPTDDLMESFECRSNIWQSEEGVPMCDPKCHQEHNKRVPGGRMRVVELVDEPFISVTDQNDKERNCFKPGEPIRYHVDFYITGRFDDPDGWWVQAINSGGYSTAGAGWKDPIDDPIDPINFGKYFERGPHHLHMDKTIPENAANGEAYFRMELKIAQCQDPSDMPGRPWRPGWLPTIVKTIEFQVDSGCTE